MIAVTLAASFVCGRTRLHQQASTSGIRTRALISTHARQNAACVLSYYCNKISAARDNTIIPRRPSRTRWRESCCAPGLQTGQGARARRQAQHRARQQISPAGSRSVRAAADAPARADHPHYRFRPQFRCRGFLPARLPATPRQQGRHIHPAR
ncbi:hypothetical protein SDC9_06677 [bioreactor metagenome]|uniref:Uncharacterized protein n=1 Tax=bioreactor metagenome TaxID=1076179 RepID=A0A644T2X1_9ZZZZ